MSPVPRRSAVTENNATSILPGTLSNDGGREGEANSLRTRVNAPSLPRTWCTCQESMEVIKIVGRSTTSSSNQNLSIRPSSLLRRSVPSKSSSSPRSNDRRRQRPTCNQKVGRALTRRNSDVPSDAIHLAHRQFVKQSQLKEPTSKFENLIFAWISSCPSVSRHLGRAINVICTYVLRVRFTCA